MNKIKMTFIDRQIMFGIFFYFEKLYDDVMNQIYLKSHIFLCVLFIFNEM